MFVTLKSISELITKGTTPSNFSEKGIMFFRSELVGKKKYIDISSGLLYITEETNKTLKRSILKENDILFSIAGAYLGKISIVSSENIPSNTNQAVGIIRLKRDICNTDYVYYYMKQKSFNEYISSLSAQAAQPNINLAQLGKLKIDFPSIQIQNKIASILSAYDNLIENNNKRIKILEQMAENIYKEWFVRFRFPNRDNEITPYKIYKLSDLLTIKNGKDYKNISEGIYPVYGSGGFMCSISKYLYDKSSILLPRKGSLSNIQYADFPFWTVDTLYYSVINENLVQPFYLYYYLKNLDLSGYDSGASIPSMTSKTYYNIKIKLPSKQYQDRFMEIITPTLSLIKKLNRQNQNLIKQRDLLLPRLMSGKLEIKEQSDG